MIVYTTTVEIAIGRVTIAPIDVNVTLVDLGHDSDSEWTVSKIEAEGVIEILDGYGLKDFKTQWVDVPKSSLLFSLLLRELYDGCKLDMDAAWEAGKLESATT